jgi:hypothetical protein
MIYDSNLIVIVGSDDNAFLNPNKMNIWDEK